MASISLDGIAHAYDPNPSGDSDYALKPLHYQWEDGGAYALLGPSGCGKTTLLNIISGLLRPGRRVQTNRVAGARPGAQRRQRYFV